MGAEVVMFSFPVYDSRSLSAVEPIVEPALSCSLVDRRGLELCLVC